MNTNVSLIKNFILKSFGLSIVVFLCLILPSCRTIHQPTYFQNAERDTILKSARKLDMELKIKKGDILSINISSVTPDVLAYNMANVIGYLVDNEGNIDLMKAGKLYAEGKTKQQLKREIEQQLIPYLKDPLVSIKYMNHKVTVLGEVARPQVYPILDENFTIFDLISTAGEITPNGKRDNVLIIRDSASIKHFKRVNLNNISVFTSDYLYLKPDDIVYVEPKIVKIVFGSQTTQIISLAVSVLSVFLIIIKGFK